MNPYFDKIINDINNGKKTIDLSDSNLTDENIKVISGLIKNNNTIEVLQIKNKLIDNYVNKYIYYNNITFNEIENQYENNIKNKITINGYNYLFDALKYNKSIHTLIFKNIFRFNEEILISGDFIDKLSEMLLINESIINLTFMSYNIISSYNNLDKLFNAINNHKIFFETLIIQLNCDYKTSNIILDSLKNQTYLHTLKLTNPFLIKYKFINLIQKLEYIQNLEIHYSLLYNTKLSELLENKETLTKLTIKVFDSIPDYTPLIKILNTNKNITYLNILHIYNHIDYNFIQSIINSNLHTLKIRGSKHLQINDILDIIQNNNTITNLDISNNYITNDFDKLFNILKFNENITKLNVSNNKIKQTDLISLNELIKNNNTITKLKMYECLELNNSKTLEIFNSLTKNETLQIFKVSDINLSYNFIINDDFIDTIYNLINNNKTLYNLSFDNLMYIEQHFYDVLKLNQSYETYLKMNLLTNKQYNKIKEAIKYNNTLIKFRLNEIYYTENFKNNL